MKRKLIFCMTVIFALSLGVKAQPTITQDPADTTICQGNTATFVVADTGGSGTITYTWIRNGTDTVGNNDTLSVVADSATAGTYQCFVCDTIGCDTSAVATLTVNFPPIATANIDGYEVEGNNVIHTATQTGTGPFTYQWLLDGFAIPGETDDTLSLIAVDTSDVGNYACVVTGICGVDTSNVGTLTVFDLFSGSFVYLGNGFLRQSWTTVGNVDTNLIVWDRHGMDSLTLDSITAPDTIVALGTDTGSFVIGPYPPGAKVFSRPYAWGDSVMIPHTGIIMSYQISCDPITITSVSGTFFAGTSFSDTSQASGGTAPYSYSVDTVPPGLSFDSTGVWSGVPAVSDTFVITVSAVDAFGCTGIEIDTLIFACPTISASEVASDGQVGTAYNDTIVVSGGTSPYSFALTSGTLPSGLTLDSASGTISGIPTQEDTSVFTVTVTDTFGCSGSVTDTVIVTCPAVSVGSLSSPDTVGTSVSDMISVSGGTSPYSFSIDTLPQGLSLDTVSGIVSGIPTSAGTVIYTITVTDTFGCQGVSSDTLTVVCPTISVSGVNDSAETGTAYQDTVTASGGTSPYTFAVTSGSLPTGLTLDSTTGIVSGTPTADSTFTFTVTATDTFGCSGSVSDTIVVECQTMVLDSIISDTATMDQAYSDTIVVTGGTPPYSIVVSSGSLPDSVSIDSVSSDSLIAISGTPTDTGNFAFMVTVTDTFGCDVSQGYTIVVETFSISLDSVDCSGGTQVTADGSSKNNEDPNMNCWITWGELNFDSTNAPITLALGDTAFAFTVNTKPGTSYQFQLRAFGAGMTTPLQSNTLTCTTDAVPPEIVSTQVVAKDTTTATIKVEYKTNGETSQVKFESGQTQQLNSSPQVKNVSGEGFVFFDLTGLPVNDTTYYRLTITNSKGSDQTSILTLVTDKYEITVVVLYPLSCTPGKLKLDLVYTNEDPATRAWMIFERGDTSNLDINLSPSTKKKDLNVGYSLSLSFEVDTLKGDTIYSAKLLYMDGQGVLRQTPAYKCEVPVGMEEIGAESTTLHVYPNPVSGVLYISSSIRDGKFVLYDEVGRKVAGTVLRDGKGTLKIDIAPGFYIFYHFDKDSRHAIKGKLIVK